MNTLKGLRAGLAITAVLGIGYTLWHYIFLFQADRLVFKKGNTIVGDYTNLVNVFIGTRFGGHVFPGATVPHGMVKVGLDTDSNENHAGYDAAAKWNVTGFSQLHEDGTGGQPPLQNFKLWPLRECESFEKCPFYMTHRKTLRVTKEDGTPDDFGTPGYFSSNLSTGIRVELTATRRTALHRYTFPPKPEESQTDWRPRIILDITNDGQKSGYAAKVDIKPEVGRVMASASFRSSFGPGAYKAFTCVDFRRSSQPSVPLPLVEWGVYSAGKIKANATNFEQDWDERGAIFTFDPSSNLEPETILARVGISLISTEQACRTANEELPDFDLARVREEARSQWNDLLGRIDVEFDDRETAVLFYSSLYRTHIVPADYSDENPLWLSSEPYYDSLYCNWDTYRTLYPLMSLHDPETYARVVRSFIDIQQHEGWLPECRGATLQMSIQGGTSGDPILAEFYIKYKDHMSKFSIDEASLYAALIQDAEVQSPHWDVMGRQVNEWKAFGFLPFDIIAKGGMSTRHVSRTLEYAFDDFTISMVAKAMGIDEDAAKYANRSRGFEYMWDPTTPILDDDGKEVKGIRGFMQLRLLNGSFVYTDPRHCTVHDPKHSTCYLDGINRDGFYEGGPIVYSQYVPHDTAKLIELQGGVKAFVRRLDFIFDNEYFDSTNEPSQQMPFMYHYANRPAMSAIRSRQTLKEYYNTTVIGLPGNDDSGAMGSFVAFQLIGLYPLPATRQFLIYTPHFSRVTLTNPYFKTTTIIRTFGYGNAKNFGVGEGLYIKSITINGVRWKSVCYIEWDVFETGGIIDLELTTDSNIPCGKNAHALPPSLSTGGYV